MCTGADNSTGLKPFTEALAFSRETGGVGERCGSSEHHREVRLGATTSENAGMSSVLLARN